MGFTAVLYRSECTSMPHLSLAIIRRVFFTIICQIVIENKPFARRSSALDHRLRRRASLPTVQDVVGRAAEVARRSTVDLHVHTHRHKQLVRVIMTPVSELRTYRYQGHFALQAFVITPHQPCPAERRCIFTARCT